MAGIEGIIQRLRDECEEIQRQVDDLLLEVKARQAAIAAIEATMNGHLVPAVARETFSNPFETHLIAHDVFEVLAGASEPLSVKQIYLLIRRTCTEKGVSSAVYAEPEVFEKVREGQFQLAPAYYL